MCDYWYRSPPGFIESMGIARDRMTSEDEMRRLNLATIENPEPDERAHSALVAVTYDGPLRAEEMVAVRDQLTTVVRERGSARLLVEYGTVDLGRVEPRAMWEDLRTAGVLMDLTRVAVVADPGWIETLASMVGTALPVEVRSFGRDQRDHAVAWLYA